MLVVSAGKPRSSSCCIQVAVPVQSIENKIEVSKIHVSTLYGAFSFKNLGVQKLISE
jgi:hypothetical protein